ncbi:mechanosensitive ion channel family protein [Neisseria sp. S1]|uniref:mechanosensitive ion channel family protein n=1 Tax=Neisseria sp. S1 TaxID=3318354 RepID=UPI003A89A05C
MLNTLFSISGLRSYLNVSASELIVSGSSGITEFFNSLFARQYFTSKLLERSFTHLSSWIELGLCFLLLFLTAWLAQYWVNRYRRNQQGFLRHLLQRAAWPLILLASAVASLSLWTIFIGNPLWFHLLVMAARWLLIIRITLAIINAALPTNRYTDWLERSMSGVLWITFLFWISGIDDMIIDGMKSVKIPLGATTLNLYTILTGLLWIGIIIVLALWLARFIENRLMNSERIDLNLRIVFSKIIKTVMIFLSVLIALPLVGIDLTVLSVFSGALGVGIGFGLQKVASNYISGFIILGDRSIRPGDRLTVNNFTGYVTKITSRFVVLKSASGTEALIPNETFVTSTVINESYTEKALWQGIDIQVAYKTDLNKAMTILEAAAAAQERIQNDPAPKAFLVNFGENGIDLRLGFWVKDPENGFAGLFSNILMDIWQQFNENGIEFPYPQRDVRIVHETAETKADDLATTMHNDIQSNNE